MQLKPSSTAINRGWFFAACSALCMSLFPISFRQLNTFNEALPSITAIFVTALLLSLLLGLYQILSKQLSPKPVKPFWEASAGFTPTINKHPGWGYVWVILVAVSALAGNWWYFVALQILDPAVALSIQRTELIFVALFGALFLHEPINPRLGLAIMLAMIGIFAIQKAILNIEWAEWRGILASLASACGFALMLLFSKLALGYYSANQINSARLIVLVVGLLAIPSIAQQVIRLPLEAWYLAFLSALFGPFGSRLFLIEAIKNLTLAKTLLISMTAPLLSALWQWLFLGLAISLNEIIGASLILAGICIMILPSRSKPGQQGSARP